MFGDVNFLLNVLVTVYVRVMVMVMVTVIVRLTITIIVGGCGGDNCSDDIRDRVDDVSSDSDGDDFHRLFKYSGGDVAIIILHDCYIQEINRTVSIYNCKPKFTLILEI